MLDGGIEELGKPGTEPEPGKLTVTKLPEVALPELS